MNNVKYKIQTQLKIQTHEQNVVKSNIKHHPHNLLEHSLLENYISLPTLLTVSFVLSPYFRTSPPHSLLLLITISPAYVFLLLVEVHFA